MRVGGSTANAAGINGAASLDRSAAGDVRAAINRRIIRRLRETDEELRAKLRREALSESGVPHFVDTRGPDLGLYTVDGTVVGGMLSPETGQVDARSNPTHVVTPIPEESQRQPVASGTGTKAPGVAASEARAPASGASTRGAAAYSASSVGVGASRDLKA